MVTENSSGSWKWNQHFQAANHSISDRPEEAEHQGPVTGAARHGLQRSLLLGTGDCQGNLTVLWDTGNGAASSFDSRREGVEPMDGVQPSGTGAAYGAAHWMTFLVTGSLNLTNVVQVYLR